MDVERTSLTPHGPGAPTGSVRRMLAVALVSLAVLVAPRTWAEDAEVEIDRAAGTSEAQRLFGAIVKVQTRAVPGARSSANLGEQREGTGVLIDRDGLILTIGYLIVEADEVKVTDRRGRTLAAKVVGYDHPSGLGLVKVIDAGPFRPLALGDSAPVREREPVMIVNNAGPADVTLGYVVSRRSFTGNWEYALDEAIFTAPPTLNWSGAALIGKDGRLIGIGSLVVRDAVQGETPLPGNMFVPIDVLKPVLEDLVRTGRRAGPARPWLGVNADEVQGRLFVARVSPDGPAERAGLEPGDIILGIGRDGVHSQAEFYRKLWSFGAAGAEVPLRVLHDLDVREVKVRSMDRMEYYTASPGR